MPEISLEWNLAITTTSVYLTRVFSMEIFQLPNGAAIWDWVRQRRVLHYILTMLLTESQVQHLRKNHLPGAHLEIVHLRKQALPMTSTETLRPCSETINVLVP